MKENALVQLFQTVSGTLNLIDCWVCSLPLDSYDRHLIVLPLNLIEKSIWNSRSWLQLLYLPCKTAVSSSWCLPHLNSIAFTQILWGRLLVAWTNGTVCMDCSHWVLSKSRIIISCSNWTGNPKAYHLAGRPCWDTGWQCLPDWCRPYLDGPNNINSPLFLGELFLPSGQYYLCGSQTLTSLHPKKLDFCTFECLRKYHQ